MLQKSRLLDFLDLCFIMLFLYYSASLDHNALYLVMYF